jgi:hypothetical protein
MLAAVKLYQKKKERFVFLLPNDLGPIACHALSELR